MFHPRDGIMGAFALKMTQWKKYLYFSIKCAYQKLSNYYAEITPTMGVLLIAAYSFNSFKQLRLSKKRNNGMEITCEEESLYTTHY
jgi:hypothetical protein